MLVAVLSNGVAAESPDLPAGVRSVLNVRNVPDNTLSIYVENLESGESTLAWNEAQPRNPASVAKLLTTLVALDTLGPSYRWRTEVYLQGDVVDGKLDGDLLLKGYGDPFLVTERVWQMLRQIRQSGIKQIGGDLLLDDSYFSVEASDPAEFDGEPLRAYNVQPNALLTNFKVVRYVFEPDPASKAVRVTLDPALDNLQVINKLSQVTGQCYGYQRGITITPNENQDRFVLSGRFPDGCARSDGRSAPTSPSPPAPGPSAIRDRRRGLAVVRARQAAGRVRPLPRTAPAPARPDLRWPGRSARLVSRPAGRTRVAPDAVRLGRVLTMVLLSPDDVRVERRHLDRPVALFSLDVETDYGTGRTEALSQLDRFVDLMAGLEVPWTAFVEGQFFETRRDVCRLLRDAGVDVQVHCHDHTQPGDTPEALGRSAAACADFMGRPAEGYRAHTYRLTRPLYDTLIETGFLWDSSIMRAVAQGHDIKLSPQHFESNRNFTTKLWNASRFAEMNECTTVAGFDPSSNKETLNRWIAHETQKALREVTEAIEAYKFNDAAGALYRFVWNIYCDWYLELVKPVLGGPDSPAKTETRAMVAWVRDEIFKMLHPFMPFVTEELWRVTAEQGPPRDGLLALAPWPTHARLADHAAESEIGWVIDIVTAIRSVRAEMNLTVATELSVVLAGVSPETDARAGRWADMIRRLARLSSLSVAKAVPPGSIQLVVRGEVVALPLKGVIDFAAEEARLQKEIARVDADIARVDAKLNNPKFVQNAAEEIVEGEREKREEAEGRRAKILEALERLKGAA